MKFRILNITNILALAMLLLVNHFSTVPVMYFALLELTYLSLIFFGCINISWGFFMPVLCAGKTNEHCIALSFDDGPNSYTGQILDTLNVRGVPATFFCIGKNISGSEPLLQRMMAEGHVVGNHSYSHHFWFDMFSAERMLADMRQMDEEVTRVTGLKPLLFRPPYGVMNPTLKKAIVKSGYTPIGWSIRSFDTTIKDEQKLLTRIMRQVKPGAIILLHDSMPITATILPALITQIKNRGYKIVRLDKMLNIPAYA